MNTQYQDFFRHQNTAKILEEEEEDLDSSSKQRFIDEFDPNNPDSMDFIQCFCDFTFSTALHFTKKASGMLRLMF